MTITTSMKIKVIKNKIADTEREIEAKKQELERTKRELEQAEKECCQGHHDWDVKYAPIYTPAYTIPGDAPGTMGIDWRGPCHVSAETKPRWIRTCKECGKVEETTSSEPETTQKPRF